MCGLGALREGLKDKDLEQLFAEAAAGSSARDAEAEGEACDAARAVQLYVLAYKVAQQRHDSGAATSALSALTDEAFMRDFKLDIRRVMALCSERQSLEAQADVTVHGNGRRFRRAIVVSVGEDVCEVQYYKLVGAAASRRWTNGTLLQAADWRQGQVVAAVAAAAAYAAGRGLQDGEQAAVAAVQLEEVASVPISKVALSAAVVCTMHQVKKAKEHAGMYFPGAPVPPLQKFTRVGLSGLRATAVAAFIVRADNRVHAEASKRNSYKGLKFLRRDLRKRQYRKLCCEMKAKQLRPPSWGTYFYLVTTGEYADLTKENCACGTCRDCGYDANDELNDILDDVQDAYVRTVGARDLPEGHLRSLRRRNDSWFRWAQGEFSLALAGKASQHQNACAYHCTMYALSAMCDERHACECGHEGGTQEQCHSWPGPEHCKAKEPPAGWWNDFCVYCNPKDEDTGDAEDGDDRNTLMCNDCVNVAHKGCATRHVF
jgi:hypothetical protein